VLGPDRGVPMGMPSTHSRVDSVEVAENQPTISRSSCGTDLWGPQAPRQKDGTPGDMSDEEAAPVPTDTRALNGTTTSHLTEGGGTRQAGGLNHRNSEQREKKQEEGEEEHKEEREGLDKKGSE
jgi:hypothetical protein